jgi:hypothetical protein
MMMYDDVHNRPYYCPLDRQYDVRSIVDRTGAIVERYAYNACGLRLAELDVDDVEARAGQGGQVVVGELGGSREETSFREPAGCDSRDQPLRTRHPGRNLPSYIVVWRPVLVRWR